jgi:hypothetical protein
LAVGCAPLCALTLTGLTTPPQPTATLDPCPEHPGRSCVATVHDAQLLSTGPNAALIAAWNTALPGIWNPSLWQLNWSATPLDTTLNITTYEAHNYPPGDPNYGAYYAGGEIRVEWTPTPDQSDLRWIQALHTNRPAGTASQNYLDCYINRPPLDMPPAYMYSYADHHFYDKPGRWCEADQHIYWDAYLYLARIDRTAKSVTIYEGIQWGWTLDCVVPEPGSIVVLLGGCGWVGVARFRRR